MVFAFSSLNKGKKIGSSEEKVIQYLARQKPARPESSEANDEADDGDDDGDEDEDEDKDNDDDDDDDSSYCNDANEVQVRPRRRKRGARVLDSEESSSSQATSDDDDEQPLAKRTRINTRYKRKKN